MRQGDAINGKQAVSNSLEYVCLLVYVNIVLNVTLSQRCVNARINAIILSDSFPAVTVRLCHKYNT